MIHFNPIRFRDLSSTISSCFSGGIVVFFPSYDYEKRVHAAWSQSGLLAKLEARKKIFREPKLSSQLETVLSDYAQVIATHAAVTPAPASSAPSSFTSVSGCTGAILLSVVGGKMSEGWWIRVDSKGETTVCLFTTQCSLVQNGLMSQHPITHFLP